MTYIYIMTIFGHAVIVLQYCNVHYIVTSVIVSMTYDLLFTFINILSIYVSICYDLLQYVFQVCNSQMVCHNQPAICVPYLGMIIAVPPVFLPFNVIYLP